MTASTSTQRRIGLALGTIAVLLLLADAASQLLAIRPVIDAAAGIGFPTTPITWQLIGGTLLVSTLLFAYPRTAVLGAILVTGFLGGAIAAHVRIGSPLQAPVLASLVIATLAWGSLWLRDERVRALL